MPDPRPVAIANTSPIQYLHQCGLIDLMAKLYQEVDPEELRGILLRLLVALEARA